MLYQGLLSRFPYPSGQPNPSTGDILAQQWLEKKAAMRGIDLLDHVIVGRAGADPMGKGFYSFREAGLV